LVSLTGGTQGLKHPPRRAGRKEDCRWDSPLHQPASRNYPGDTKQVLAKSHVRSSASNTAVCLKVGAFPTALTGSTHFKLLDRLPGTQPEANK